MGKVKLILPATLLIAGIIAIWAVPAILKAMPDRYVARLPEPIQKIGLPEDSAPILPTVESPVLASELLKTTTQFQEATPTLSIVRVISSSTTDQTSSATTEVDQKEPQASLTPPVTITPYPTSTPWPIPDSARLEGFQHKFQQWNNCGPATLAMTLTYFGLNISQEDTASILKPNPEDRNVSPDEMAAFVNEQTPFKAIWGSNGSPETIQRLIANDIPVIIEIGIEPPGEYRWMGWYGHYLLVVAYEEATEQFWVYDSWFGTSEEPLTNAHPDGRVLSYNDLDTYWPHFNRSFIILYEPEQASQVEAILGSSIDQQTMWQKALDTARLEASIDPENPFYWFNMGTNYNALGQYSEAATAFDQARALGLPWRMLWYQFGPYEAYYQTGRLEDVILLADTTLKDRPYFEESYYYKGLALAALGDENGARTQFENAIAFNPNFNKAAEALSELN